MTVTRSQLGEGALGLGFPTEASGDCSGGNQRSGSGNFGGRG